MRKRTTYLLLATAAAWLSTPADLAAQSVSQLISNLDHKNRKTRAAAYRTLYRRMPPKAVSILVKKLPTFSFHGQNYGILLLGRYDKKLRRPALRKMLKSGVPFLQVTSAIILHRAGHKKALPIIVSGLRQPGVSVTARTTMIRRLTGIKHPAVLETVRGTLVPGVHFSILAAAIDHLWAVGDPNGAAIVADLLAEKKTVGQSRALCAAFLICHDQHEHSKTLGQSLGALTVVSTVTWPYLSRARNLNKPVLAGVAAHAQRTKNITSLTRALTLLRTRDYPDIVRPLRKVANNKNERLAKTAFKYLAEMPDQLKPKELREMLQSKKPWLALFAAETLRRRDDSSGLARTLELVVEKSKQMDKNRTEAIRVLGGFRNDKTVQPLIDHLNHPVAVVRVRALTALQNVWRNLFPYRRFDFKTSGYKASGAAVEREFAVQKIQAWWDENKTP